MPLFRSPTSFRPASVHLSGTTLNLQSSSNPYSQALAMKDNISAFQNGALPPHSSHPDFGHLVLLVFEAVMEVVCVSLPGYIVARQGMFNAEMQKFVANLNVAIFTPCLIFTKLASQLTTDKLPELAIIPFIFLAQTLISYGCSFAVSKLFGFKKRPRNFVIAMGVFGNSNSLPISMVLSLSKTISGLHWDRIPGDNDNEVAARGILYLLIFQQLGQLLRWSWGYNVLLAPPEEDEEVEEHNDSRLERGERRYTDEDHRQSENENLIGGMSSDEEGSNDTNVETLSPSATQIPGADPRFKSGEQTPITFQRYTSSASSDENPGKSVKRAPEILPTPTNGNVLPTSGNHTLVSSFPSIKSNATRSAREFASGLRGVLDRCVSYLKRGLHSMSAATSHAFQRLFDALPKPLQKGLSTISYLLTRFLKGVWAFMNPPLWAMLAAIVVASIPSLQNLFFCEGSFIANSVTRAVSQSGGVAVPLILVVLGANLARNTLPRDPNHTNEDDKEDTKLLVASLVSRMLLPTIIMAPLLAVTAKFVPISILDDPIFVIVCFLLTGAPSALQLAQICQINNVYMGAISRLLFQSYVVWILPSTLVLVMLALEVVEWAATG